MRTPIASRDNDKIKQACRLRDSEAARREAGLFFAEGPKLCLEYVVAHELVHLRIPGHGPDFHALLHSVFPEEDKARRLLRTGG